MKARISIILIAVFAFLPYSLQSAIKLIYGTVSSSGGISISSDTILTSTLTYLSNQQSSNTIIDFNSGLLSISNNTFKRLQVSYSRNFVDTAMLGDVLFDLECLDCSDSASTVLFYRDGGAVQFKELAPVEFLNNSFSFRIDSTRVNIRGLEYYFEISNNNNRQKSQIGNSSSFYTLLINSGDKMIKSTNLLRKQTYQMITLPMVVDSSFDPLMLLGGRNLVYDSTQVRIGRYEALDNYVHEYPDIPKFSPTLAYWIIANYDNIAISSSGISLVPDTTIGEARYYSQLLDSGWNQLGNPFAFPIDFDQMEFLKNGSLAIDQDSLIESSVHFYTGASYYRSTLIPPWTGFFLFAKQSGVTALFPYQEALLTTSSNKPKVVLENNEWLVGLTLYSRNQIDSSVVIGARNNATNGIDKFELSSPPPPSKESISLSLLIENDQEKRPRLADIRSSNQPFYKFYLKFSGNGDKILKLNNLESVLDNYNVTLIANGISKEISLDRSSVKLNREITGAEIIVESIDKYSPSDIKPVAQLFQNYPNPFNPTTRIPVYISKDTTVRVEIFNTIGRKVIVLVDSYQDAGVHYYDWDGRSQSGNMVSSGFYYIRLTIGEYRASGKMLFLK